MKTCRVAICVYLGKVESLGEEDRAFAGNYDTMYSLAQKYMSRVVLKPLKSNQDR